MASQTADTVGNILQIISDLRGESTTNTDASRIRAVSRAEQSIARRGFFRVHLRRNQTATGDGVTGDLAIDTTTYPMRYHGLVEVFVGGTTEAHRYGGVDASRFQLLYNANSADQLVYEWYDPAADAWKMHINPIPSAGSTVTYSYYFMPPKRTSVDETVIAPDVMMVARLALAEIYEGEDEIQKSLQQKQEAEQLFAELQGRELVPAIGQSLTMGSIENQRYSKGIGTY